MRLKIGSLKGVVETNKYTILMRVMMGDIVILSKIK